jgi:hypothetical protein
MAMLLLLNRSHPGLAAALSLLLSAASIAYAVMTGSKSMLIFSLVSVLLTAAQLRRRHRISSGSGGR